MNYRIRQNMKHIWKFKQTNVNYVYHQTPKMYRNYVAFFAEYKG
jgi:hypothetical protein